MEGNVAAIPPQPVSTLDTHSVSAAPSPPFSSAGGGNSARAASPIPGVYDSSPRQVKLRGPGRGLIRVVGPDELDAAEKRSRSLEKAPEPVITELAKYIRQRFEKAVRHRRVIAVDDELIRDMRAYNGQYDPGKLQEINSFGGSKVYSRMMAMKCRGATALLRNVYMNTDRPWMLQPTADPVIPDAIDNHIHTLVMHEVISANQAGQIIPQNDVQDRLEQLYEATKLAERRKADDEAKDAQRKIDEILELGRFYEALSEFLADLPVYKYAVIKGPVTRRHTQLKWGPNGKMESHESAQFFWERVSPWDVWFSPGATHIHNTEVFERQRLSTSDLYNLIGLPGYREEDLREIISTYESRGFKEWIQIFDYERAFMEGRNNVLDDTYINAIEFHGQVLGKYLIEYGIKVDDPLKPYFITAWMVDRKVFKVMLNPSPRVRVPYYITSFDKQPGSLFGNGIPALANDLTDVINATLRALVNNLSISSGPQVVINQELIAPGTDDSLYPWKRWYTTHDPTMPAGSKPVEFYQPASNSQELMAVIDKFSVMLDDVSTIPRYLTGNGQAGGAGRTASGLSMLINNANKTLQNVADNIDNDIFKPLLSMLYDYIMLTDTTGMLRGDENIVVDGVRQASKQEQDLTRQLEFLQLINNPNYQGLLGAGEVSRVLQAIADNLGIELKVKNPDDAPGAPPPGMPPVPAAAGAGGGPNPSGDNTPGPNPAAAAPGAGGQPGISAAPQVTGPGGPSSVPHG